MADHQCNCTDVAAHTDPDAESTDRLLTSTEPLEADLPADLHSALGRFVGHHSIETLADWVAAVERHTSDETIALEELCHADAATPHWGVLEGERYYFACVYDAVLLAALTEQPVEIHTESLDGTTIEATATGDGDLTVTPETAVFSFGIEESVTPPSDSGPTLEDGYAAICPYVRAFPNVDAYERWNETMPAATVALSPAAATRLATALVDP